LYQAGLKYFRTVIDAQCVHDLFILPVCAVKTSLIGFSFHFLSGPLVENIKDVYSIQQLKQLMAHLDSNPQQFPTLGIFYGFLTSFDIDNDLKRIIASRW